MSHEDPLSPADIRDPASAGFEFAPDTMESVTQLILAAQNGQSGAWDRVYSLLYKELHKVAGLHLRRRWRGGERSPTSLINRTWLRLNQDEVALNNRQHLLAVLSRAMRYAVLDEVRRLQTSKRAEHFHPDEIEHAPEPSHDPELDQLVAIDRALTDLATIDARLGQVVEMRYFAGMNEAEIAQVLGVTERTVRRDWRRARAFLAATLGDDPKAAAN
ncbi:sigma-70 family RNA polymerase sigma factor [Lysobacter sp. 5GHs7-4]|uniref:ECF-type sigma factor n=1 Tax=Lysobacter sp. 5GHs7-4 TaxID=2904253 RepID=UPI001E2D90F6|nr:ECF-type sigma factor [Lysobacter sp. 5GHs7-4]UHQ24095.1 sigma-70 family RNA polymerase sigma factor [Lysobacter sp. 5GHs7-4]